MCIYVSVCVSVYISAFVWGGQKQCISLEFKWQVVVRWSGCWDVISGPLQEQSVLFAAEPSLQALVRHCKTLDNSHAVFQEAKACFLLAVGDSLSCSQLNFLSILISLSSYLLLFWFKFLLTTVASIFFMWSFLIIQKYCLINCYFSTKKHQQHVF